MIDRYQFGEITVDGQKYTHDVWIGLEEISQWWRSEGHAVYEDDVKGAVGEQPETVIIGNGADAIMQVSQEVYDFFQDKKIPLVVKDSGLACDEYNQLKKQGKRVVALIHLTC